MVGSETRRRNTMSSPAHKIRDGVLQVCIWRNTSDRGTYYTATPQRSYKQGDETWKETDSLNGDEVAGNGGERGDQLVVPGLCS
jgi:hypothetical protein